MACKAFLVVMILSIFSHAGQAGIKTDTGNGNYTGEFISKIDIQITNAPGDTDRYKSIARDLIPIKKDEPFSPKKITETIKILYNSQLFKRIEVPDPLSTPDGIDLVFLLTPFGRIKDIQVKGAFPIFKKEVLNVMSIYTGDAFSQEVLEKQKSRIQALFNKQGYPDPKISVSAQTDEQDGNYTILVHIEKGNFYRIKTVDIKGNKYFSEYRLKLRTKVWKSSLFFGSAARFIEKDLKDDVKNLVRFYRQNGFPDVQVTEKIQKNESKKTLDIVFLIEEGPLYQIKFKGNRQFWDYTLKREMGLSKAGTKGSIALNRGVRNIREKYTRAGYMDAKIQMTPGTGKEEREATRDIFLRIDEGHRYIVSKILITGNHGIDEKRIRKQILTRPSGFLPGGDYALKTLEEDVNAVRALYLSQGYTRARVETRVQIKDPDSTKNNKRIKFLEIEIVVDEGVRSQVGGVDFPGLSVLKPQEAMGIITLAPGSVYQEDLVKQDETALKKQISEKGYPHVQVKGRVVFSEDRSRIDLSYEVNEGPFVSLGRIFYTGNFRTRSRTLDDEMQVLEGEPLSLTGLLESRRNMMNMDALDSVRYRTLGLTEKSGRVDLIVEVEEKKPYFFEIGAGYDTERHFYGNTTLGDHNFLGKNLNFETNLELSLIGFKGDVSLTDPRFLSTRISSVTKLAGEKREEFNKDFGIKTVSLSQNFFRPIPQRNLTLDLGFTYEFREQYVTGSADLSPEEIDGYDPRNIFVTSPSLIYRTTDSFVRPRKGIFSALSADISKGVDDALDDVIKLRLDTRCYFTLFDPLTLAVRARYGIVHPYGGNKDVPEDQLFFLGGTSTVRGFDENMLMFDEAGDAIGGRQSILGSFEARYDLGMNFEITAFYDIGQLKETIRSAGSEAFRSSVGLGLRYITPIGPIGLLYGWKLDPLPGESSGNFHFSMGYTF